MYRKYLLLCMLALVPFLQGCPKKDTKITETQKINKWVYEQMARYYLWADELPDRGESRMGTPTQEYFDKNLRYRNNKGTSLEMDYYGDRFSRIEYVGEDDASTRAEERTEQDFDFGFLLSRIGSSNGVLDHLQVLYVIPGRPADRAGLRRGDTFKTINGTTVSNSNYQSLLASPTITLTTLNREPHGPNVTITMSKELFYNHPILLDTIYEDITPKTAYLLYTHFTDGADVGGNGGYAGELKAAFARYKAAGVENLILDLRYNGGGEVRNAELLASLIVPESKLGSTFMYLEDNRGKFEGRKLMTSVRSYNANIENLYVITSHNTASASEMIIHTLRPIFGDSRLYVVGQTTYGKNVGGHTITSDQYDWEISPITLRVYDLNHKSGYEKGIVPDTRNEPNEYLALASNNSDYWMLPPLGDYEHEYLLNIAMRRIDTSIPGVVDISERTRSMNRLTPTPMIPMRGLNAGTIVVD